MGTDAELAAIIEQSGWAVVRVDGDSLEPTLAYSVGMSESFAHPEIIVMGLAVAVMHTMIDTVGHLVASGRRFAAGEESTEIIEGYACCFRAVAPAAVQHYMGVAVERCGTSVAALHCVWPDAKGLYPWNQGASADFRRLQPKLSDDPSPETFRAP